MNYAQFLTVRVIGGVVVAVIILLGLWGLLNYFKGEEPSPVATLEETFPPVQEEEPIQGPEQSEPIHGAGQDEMFPPTQEAVPAPEAPRALPDMGAPAEERIKGVAFVEGTISALEYELHERFWGWRVNDLILFTDNVKNTQLGVLEVVRRTAVSLAERISRYGPTDLIDKNLESAMNWFMIKPDQYWLPSPEDKYDDGIEELKKYAEKLKKGEGRFYTRADNLIPLLFSFADLLGGCDDNLVKTQEEDGSPVSWSKVDDYFYYAKGVAMAMGNILHAVEEEFAPALQARGGEDLLEHAVHACKRAAELDPWLITDAPLDGIIANHRANMAAPISHARHYLDVLAKTLST